MSGYDETHPETYRPTEPDQAADGSHPGVDSPSAARQGASAETVSGGRSLECVLERVCGPGRLRRPLSGL